MSKPTVFQECDPNLFTVTFDTYVDKQKMMEGRPWLFDNCLFILKLFDGFSQLSKINFDSELFLVQLHNLSFAYMNRECGERIGNSIGKVVEMDLPEDGIG